MQQTSSISIHSYIHRIPPSTRIFFTKHPTVFPTIIKSNSAFCLIAHRTIHLSINRIPLRLSRREAQLPLFSSSIRRNADEISQTRRTEFTNVRPWKGISISCHPSPSFVMNLDGRKRTELHPDRVRNQRVARYFRIDTSRVVINNRTIARNYRVDRCVNELPRGPARRGRSIYSSRRRICQQK